MPRHLNILVLGVGGNVSQGILKALKLSTLPCRVVGACVSSPCFGSLTTDRFYLSPFAQSPEFVLWLIGLCQSEKINAILSGVEAVLEVLSVHKDRIQAESGAICMVDTIESMEIGGDKLVTCEWLKSLGFNYPMFAASNDSRGVNSLLCAKGFPLLGKPRKGKGAAGIVVLRDMAELERVKQLPDYILQEMLGTAESEFTVGCFSDRDDNVRGAIVMLRQLAHGTTVAAKVGDYPDVRDQAVRIAGALRPRGPSNIQLRVHEGRPVCFEINVRFSGTTAMRARFGFNDVEQGLRHYVLGEPAVDMPIIRSGYAIRYWNECYVHSSEPEISDGFANLQGVQPVGYTLEDYGTRI